MSLDNSVTRAKPSTLRDALLHLSGSKKVWFALMAYFVLVKLLLDAFFPNAFADPDQAAFFQWISIAIFGVVGFIGVVLSEHTGFPGAWDMLKQKPMRALYAIGAGVLFGILFVVFDMTTGFTRYIVAAHGVAQQYTGFVPMTLAFSAASIIVEVVHRLFIIPLLLFLISNLILRGRWQTQIFWVLAIVLSGLEPFLQSRDVLALPMNLAPIYAVVFYALNFVQVVFFRRYGYLSSYLMRVAFYIVWHAIYVH
jgi:hypothetical protein